jgi:hypothetical protein
MVAGGLGTELKYRLPEMLTAEMLGRGSQRLYSMGSLDKPEMIWSNHRRFSRITFLMLVFVEESSIEQVCLSQSVCLA